MAKQNKPETEEIPEHIVNMMGPTPAEAASGAANTPSDNPASAPPLLPDDKLPPEVRNTAPSTATATEQQPEPEDSETQLAEADSTEITDSETDAAIDDIVHNESDELLTQEDEAIANAFRKPEEPKGLWGKTKHFLKAWWHNKKARNATFAVCALVLVGLLATPVSRYFILNSFGVRAGMSVVVIDEGTRQPLKNVQVASGGITATTDAEGNATLRGLKLGANNVRIEKVAFAPLTKKVTLGWGSNPLGDVALTPTGAQYRFVVKDFLTGKPLPKTEATSGLASAVADEKGEIVLTVDVGELEKIDVIINVADYRTEQRTIATSLKDTQTIKMAPAQQHVFVSKRSGKYDLYKVYADGKGEKLLLSATGAERDDMVVARHPSKPLVALVSTRDNTRNEDGFLLSSLLLINIDSGETQKVATSERIQVTDWVGDRLVYVTIAAGQSANSPKRHRLVVYDSSNNEQQELAYSNYFNDVMVAKGVIYYAPSSNNQKSKTALYKVNPDGTNAQVVLDKEAWNLFRVDYDTMQFSVGQAWYEYKLGDVAPTQMPGAPADPKNRLYRDSPDRAHSLWVDQRDGKGVLLAYDTTRKQDKTVKNESGLRNPVAWLSNSHIVYRINTEQETADYVISLDGGQPQKIQDVTNTGGVDRWYYYQ